MINTTGHPADEESRLDWLQAGADGLVAAWAGYKHACRFWSGGLVIAVLCPVLQAANQIPPAWETPDTKPKALFQEQPVYPAGLALAGIGGYVEVEFVIDTTGRPVDLRVRHSNNPWLERPAMNAVRNWRFTPAKKNGKPVPLLTTQRIEFAMEDNPGSGSPWQIKKGKDHESMPPELRWETPPEPRQVTFPVYPFEALQARQTGETVHSILIDSEGHVAKIQQLEASTPAMGLAVQAMLDAWGFTPAKDKSGQPCFATLTMKHSFALTKRSDVPVTESASEIMTLLRKSPERIISAKALDQVPKFRWGSAPVYPTALLEARKSGLAVMEVFIDQEGDIQLPRIISATAPEFGYAAAQALVSWHFEIPRKEGKPVITRLRVPVEFKGPEPAKPNS